MKKKTFSVFPKILNNGTRIYYYTAYDEAGKRRQFSTGKTAEIDAYQECLNRMQEGHLIPTSNLYFEKYVQDYFKHEGCPYYGPRIGRGRVYSLSSLDHKRSILTNHITPYFSGKKLDVISTKDIENWLNRKKQAKYSNTSCNHFLSVVRLIYREAERRGDIKNNPVSRVLPYAKDSREKGIITREEFRVLFDKNSIDTVWNGNELHYLVNYTAAVTGMRIGELLALKKENIGDQYIQVKHSWDRKYGIKCTKSGKERIVPIPSVLSGKLHKLADELGGRFVFSGKSPFTPIDHKTVQKYFKRALDSIGIAEEERKERNITFHSWRHFANTMFRESGIADSIVRNIMGHSSSQMTDLYSHFDVREMDINWEHVI